MRLLALLLLFAAPLAYGQTCPDPDGTGPLPAPEVCASKPVHLSVFPQSGLGPLTVTLTWRTYAPAGFTSCVGELAWGGDKPLNGSQTISGVNASKSYRLTCSTGTASAILACIAPTQNTDGSDLTDLAGYQVFHASTWSGVEDAAAANFSVLTPPVFPLAGLPPGPRYFAVKARSSSGALSGFSNRPTKTLQVDEGVSATVSVTVTPTPKAPICPTVT